MINVIYNIKQNNQTNRSLTKGDTMSFNTNKYTRPVLVAELRKLNGNSFLSVSALAKAISPRAGTKSAKIAALKQFSSSKGVAFNSLFKTTYSGSTVKKQILSILT
jgi:hypothetical protein